MVAVAQLSELAINGQLDAYKKIKNTKKNSLLVFN